MTTRTRLHELLVVTGLTGFAISQPLLSVLGDNPIVFTRGRVVGSSLVVFVLVLALVPPLVLWAVGALASLVHRRLGDVAHLITVGGLVGLAVIQVVRQLFDVDAALPLGLAAVGSALLFVAAYDRWRPIAMWSQFTAPLPLLAMALFLLSSPAGALAREQPSIEPVADAAERSGPPVVFVMLDEFPTRSLLDAAGGLDRVRFPRLAEFAEDATWYRHYTSLAPLTSVAVPSVLSGRLPGEEPATAASHPDSIFTMLAPTHDLVVSEAATSLCALDRCEDPAPRPEDAGILGVLGTAFDVWQGRVSLSPDGGDPLAEFAEEGVATSASASDEVSWNDILEGATVRGTPVRVQAFIDSLDAARGPALYYVHAILPHQPWVTWPDGTGYQEPDVASAELSDDDRAVRFAWSDAEAAVSEQRHLLQAEHADRLIGRILDTVRDEGMYDESLIVVMADHGVSFETGTRARVATEETLDSIAYVPLLVKPPGQTTGRIDDSNITAVDVLPTVAAAVGLEVPWAVDGFAAGAPEIDARGTQKDFYVYQGLFAPEIVRIVQFDDAATFPSASDRWIAPRAEGSEPAAALWEALGVADLIGQDVESLGPIDDGGAASVIRLDDILQPPIDELPIGLVQGRITEGPRRGRALLAVEGRIVSGALLAADERGDVRFSLLVEPGTITSGDAVELLVQDEGATTRLTIEG